MKLIKELSEMIEEELEDAEKYAKCALKFKDENQTLAQTFHELSLEEIKHMERLHGEVRKAITIYRQQHGEPPEVMMALYDYIHGKFVDKTAKIKILQNQFRGIS